MSIRLPSGLPRPGLPLQGPAQEKGEKAQQPAEAKTPGKATGKGVPAKGGPGVKGGAAKGTSAKGGAEQSGPQDGMDSARSGETERNEGGGARGAKQQDGMSSSTSRGAASLGTLEQPPPPTAQTCLLYTS
ncbi:hypothetical protein, partial [Corallococcus carmarthensis]